MYVLETLIPLLEHWHNFSDRAFVFPSRGSNNNYPYQSIFSFHDLFNSCQRPSCW